MAPVSREGSNARDWGSVEGVENVEGPAVSGSPPEVRVMAVVVTADEDQFDHRGVEEKRSLVREALGDDLVERGGLDQAVDRREVLATVEQIDVCVLARRCQAAEFFSPSTEDPCVDPFLGEHRLDVEDGLQVGEHSVIVRSASAALGWQAASLRVAATSDLGLTVIGVPARGSVRLVDGSTREMLLAELTAAAVLSAVPWRSVRSHRGQRHLPGWYWSATTSGHVVYESRLELARLLLADFDPDVVGIAAQPFLVRDAERRHVPDFLLRRVDGSVLIVNVKPAERLEDERVAGALAWAASVFADRGWEHEIWSGADAQLLANVRFLAGYRRSWLLEPVLDTARVLPAGAVLTIAAAEVALKDAGVGDPRPVVLGQLWSGRLRADLQRPLDGDSELEVLW